MMSYKKSFIVAAFVLLTVTGMMAASVDAGTARASATSFIRSQASGKLMIGATPDIRLQYTEQSSANNGSADYYVFDVDDGKAFVIVAGDDRAEGILGYGDGKVDMANLPCNMQWLLNSYKEQLEWLHSHPGARVNRAEDTDDATVPPMLTCNWSQSAPYWNQCPMYNGERCVTGCVATAMAQVMYYWRYPSRAPSLSAYKTRTHNISVPTLQGKVLNWDEMIDNYRVVQYTESQADAVATLMRYCGQSCHMDYSPDGSGAYVSQQLSGMRAFGYSNTIMVERSSYNREDWDAMIKQEILQGHPVLFSGNDNLQGGHAFVLDGCNNGRYHINWGWAGTGDGYFRLDAFSVEGYSFNSYQQMLIHIYPDVIEHEDGYDFESDGFYYMYDEDGTGVYLTYRDTRYDSYSGDVVIPSQVTYDGETLPVRGIGRGSFRNCERLTSVTLPSTITVLEDYAFRNCTRLARVNLPEGLTSIGAQAFANCMNLERVELPSSLTSIGNKAFQDCFALTHVEIPTLESWLQIAFVDHYGNPLSYAHRLFVAGEEVHDLVIPASVGKVPRYAFIECEGLTSLTLEEGVTAVGVASFSYCTGLKSLSLPSSLSTIDDQVFFGCTGLKEVVLPDSLTALNYAAFASCSGLRSINIPEGLTIIDDYVFHDCVSLSSISFPASMEAIGYGAFNGCSGLNEVVMSPGIKQIGAIAFSGCDALQNLVLSDSLTTIGDEAFSECFALTDVVIPDKVTAIGEKSFFKCIYLKHLTLGRAVETIDDRAFDNNPRMVSVTSLATVPPTLATPSSFTRSIYDKAVLYVPAGLQQTYKHSGIWGWFTRIEPIITTATADVNLDGEITVADVNAVISTITTGAGDLTRDVNGDGEVSIADVNAVISIILRPEP